MQTHSPKKNSFFRATLAYVMALIFVVETSIPAWAQTPTATPAATATSTAAATPTGSATPFIPGSNPKDTVDRSRLQTNPLATGTPSPRSKELAEKVKADMAADPNLETEARIKFNKNKSAIDKATEDEIAKIKKNKNLSAEQKEIEIQKAKARQERAVLVEKEKFAKDLGFDNFQQVKENGIGDPAEGGLQKRGSSSVANVYFNPLTYIEYIMIISAGVWAPILFRGCYNAGCTVVSSVIFFISLIAYVLGEIIYFMMYKQASEAKLAIDRDKNFDQQEKAMKKAKEVTEQAAKAAKMKGIILSTASAGMWASMIFAIYEFTINTTGCATCAASLGTTCSYFCRCLATDQVCTNAFGQCAGPVKYEQKKRPLEMYAYTLFSKKGDYEQAWQDLKINSTDLDRKTLKRSLELSKNAQTSYALMQEHSSLNGKSLHSPDLNYWKTVVQLQNSSDPEVQKILEDMNKVYVSGYFPKYIDLYNLVEGGNILDTIISPALADNGGKTGLAASLGIGVVLAIILGVVAKTNCYKAALLTQYAAGRAIIYGIYAGLASMTAGMAVSASGTLEDHAEKYADVEKELKALREREGQVEESMGGANAPGGAALIKAAANYKEPKKEKETDYSEFKGSCFKTVKGDINSDPDCDCKKNNKCLNVEAPTADSSKFSGFTNSLGTLQLASDKTAQTVNSLGQGDLNGAASSGQAAGRLALALKKKAEELEKYVDKNYPLKDGPIGKQREALKNEFVALIQKELKKNNVDLAKELGNRLGSPSAESESQKDIAEMTEKKASPAAPAIDLSGLGGGMPAMPKDLDATDDVAAPVPEVAATPDNSEYELNSNADVVQDSGVSIWQVLSVRYIKTAMPSLLEEKVSSDHPPLVPNQGQLEGRGPQGVPEQGLPQEAPQNEATEAPQGAPAGTTEVTLPPGGAQLKEEDKLGVESNF